MSVVEFLHADGGPDTFSRLPGRVLITKTFPLYLVLKLAMEDVAVQDSLDFVVLLVVHDYWRRRGICLPTGDWICDHRPEFDHMEHWMNTTHCSR